MMMSCASRMQAEEEKIEEGCMERPSLHFGLLALTSKFWQRSAPFEYVMVGDDLHDEASDDERGGEGLIPAGGSGGEEDSGSGRSNREVHNRCCYLCCFAVGP